MTPEAITREIMGNVPAWMQTAFYAAVFVACALAAAGFALRFLKRRQGRKDEAPETAGWPGSTAGSPRNERAGGSLRSTPATLFAKIAEVARYLTFHEQLRRDLVAGLGHMLLVYGFVVLFIGTCLVFLEHQTPLHFFYGRFYLISSLAIDLGGFAFLVGCAVFIRRRLGRGSQRILRQWWVASLVWLLFAIGVTGFLLEGARIAESMPAFERWSVGGYAVAVVLRGLGISGETALAWHRVLWAGHAVLCVAFFALLPWRFFSHMVYGAISWATRTERPRGKLRPAAAKAGEPGVTAWQQFRRRDLLQVDACTTCGRCNEVCPAAAAGKPLQPREVVLAIRQSMNGNGNGATTDLPAAIGDDVLYSCTTCGACNEACPVGIEIFDKIVDLRRGRIESGTVPAPAEEVFESAATNYNPFNKPQADRLAFAGGLDLPVADEGEPIELLYWIGCAGSFDPDGQQVVRNMLRILNHLGIDYRILGKRECCTGDPARRLGEEGLFQELAHRNIAVLRQHGVRRILTHCPHCFNAFQNEYPELGGEYTVEHHSQFLARQIREGRLKLPRGSGQRMTFHDPCYLGRGNGETAAPRDVLAALPQVELTEMPRHGRQSFCCGAGGGAMWTETRGSTRVENVRAEEAAETGATTVATGCPFCKSMLAAGTQGVENNGHMRVRDLAELVVEAEGL